jgi:hypothetical protein
MECARKGYGLSVDDVSKPKKTLSIHSILLFLAMACMCGCSINALTPDSENKQANLRTPGGDNSSLKSSDDVSVGIKLLNIGDVEASMLIFDRIDKQRVPARAQPELRFPVSELIASDAIEEIVKQASDKKIVFLNEAHNVPLNRAFAQRLASRLRHEGFSYLAVEALGDDIDDHIKGHAVLQSAGYYTREPYFGSFLRSALEDGWKLVAYDEGGPLLNGSGLERINERERRQAENIVNRTLKVDKSAKILVYAGYGHIQKKGERLTPPVTMMAERVRRLTGVPTLHIDQVAFNLHIDKTLQGQTYTQIVDKFRPTNPIVLKEKHNDRYVVSSELGDSVDMQVIFPNYSFSDTNGRPEWISALLGRQPLAVDLPEGHSSVVFSAFYENDPEDAVPIDTIRLNPGSRHGFLMIPAESKIRVRRFDSPPGL